MTKEFVPYELALELKKLGFDETGLVKVWWLNDVNNDTKRPFVPRITIYGKDIDFEYPMPENHPFTEFDILELQIPTFSQAFRFFREKYNLCHVISGAGRDGEFNAFVKDYIYGNNGKFSPSIFTYEEAELACLNKLIEIVKTK